MSMIMEKLRRLQESVSTTRPREVAETAIRLSIATVVNFYLSQFIFSHKMIPLVDKAFQATPLGQMVAFRMDPDRLPKMYRLWPPHAHIELIAVFTVTLYILLKYFMTTKHVWQLLRRRGRNEKFEDNGHPQRPCSAFVARLLSVSVVALAVFVLLLPMQRLAEMHIFVVGLNFFHALLICVSSAVIMFSFADNSSEKLKEE